MKVVNSYFLLPACLCWTK